MYVSNPVRYKVALTITDLALLDKILGIEGIVLDKIKRVDDTVYSYTSQHKHLDFTVPAPNPTPNIYCGTTSGSGTGESNTFMEITTTDINHPNNQNFTLTSSSSK